MHVQVRLFQRVAGEHQVPDGHRLQHSLWQLIRRKLGLRERYRHGALGVYRGGEHRLAHRQQVLVTTELWHARGQTPVRRQTGSLQRKRGGRRVALRRERGQVQLIRSGPQLPTHHPSSTLAEAGQRGDLHQFIGASAGRNRRKTRPHEQQERRDDDGKRDGWLHSPRPKPPHRRHEARQRPQHRKLTGVEGTLGLGQIGSKRGRITLGAEGAVRIVSQTLDEWLSDLLQQEVTSEHESAGADEMPGHDQDHRQQCQPRPPAAAEYRVLCSAGRTPRIVAIRSEQRGDEHPEDEPARRIAE